MSARISKFLSLVLRHEPERIGIALDEAGWTDVAALLAAAAAHGVVITRAELAEVVATSDKQRFALSPDGARIRANQGHSVDVELALAPHVPAQLIDWPAPHADGGRRRGGLGRDDKVRIAKETLAACEAGAYTNAHGARVPLAFDPEATAFYDRVPAWSSAGHATRIALTAESTIDAIRRLGDGCVALNFASAKNPGGGFLGGAQAQEESLARSSALYPCIANARAFYGANRAARSVLYLDLALYSPRVPFFRDDNGGWFDAPVYADVLTCAAPNASALRQHGRFDADECARTLRRRAELVLAVAAHHGAERLVLGAWGAGVFGNDPDVVARAFADPLRGAFAGAFAEIVFAVPDPTGANHRAFAAVFG